MTQTGKKILFSVIAGIAIISIVVVGISQSKNSEMDLTASVKDKSAYPINKNLDSKTYTTEFSRFIASLTNSPRVHTNIRKFRRDLGMMIIQHIEVVESAEAKYALYDIHNDKVYENFGFSSQERASYPIDFITNDKVIFLTTPENSNHEISPSIEIRDLKNNLVKKLQIDFPKNYTSFRTDIDDSGRESLEQGLTLIFVIESDKEYKTYYLNPRNFELKAGSN